VPKDIFHVQPGTAFDEQPDYVFMASARRLVQRRGVGMSSDGVVSVGIFARIQQQTNHFDVAKLCCQGECQVAIFRARVRKAPPGFVDASEGCRYWQIDPNSPSGETVYRLEFSVQRCRSYCGIRIGSVIAEQVHQRKLYATFPRNFAGTDKHQRLGYRGALRAGIENNSGHLDNVRGQTAMAHRILSYEFKQAWIAKVVPSFENYALMYQAGMLLQMGA
jgi:hypothetical protein